MGCVAVSVRCVWLVTDDAVGRASDKALFSWTAVWWWCDGGVMVVRVW